MPFETIRPNAQRIAVIGGGISGMGAARFLASDHEVVLYEAEPRLGGHARTVVAGRNGDQPVDTGFIVFNYANYPHLASLFDDLNVPVVPSNMSFGASINGGAFEYGLASLGALFAQKRNAANPKFLRMVRDILYFNRHGLRVARTYSGLTIGQFLEVLGTGPWFRDYYLLPLSGAIWSTPTQKIMDFPAHAMMQFFENHALLSVTGQHQWYTVKGGSASYVSRLEADLRRAGVSIRSNTAIEAVTRTPFSASVKAKGSEWAEFDAVVFATHSDDTLRLLADPTEKEQSVLGAIKYQPNDIVLHCDENIMPKRRKVWSSWVYTEDAEKTADQIDLTYWMNSLQPIPKDDPHFVTLNTKRTIREEKIYDQVTLRHPVYDLEALSAQSEARLMNGENNTWFCGAWMKNGFHEDGLSSAVDVATGISRQARFQVAAE